MQVINNGPGLLSDHAINWIIATRDVQLEIIDRNLSESLEEAEKFAKICKLNKSFATKVKDLEAAEPVQDGLSRELVAAQQELEELEEKLLIGKHCSAKLETRLDKCQSEPETTESTDITQLRLQKNVLRHQLKNISLKKSRIKSELGAFECVIQRLTTHKVHTTLAPNISEPTSGSSGFQAISEPTPGPLEAVASLSRHLTFRHTRAK